MFNEFLPYLLVGLFLLFVTLLLSLLLSVLTVPIYQLAKILRDKINKDTSWFTNKRIKYILGVASITFSIFVIYLAYFPTESTYVQEFEEETELAFPASGKFISKYTSFPDMHGRDYTEAVIEFSKEDYKSLLNDVTKNVTFDSTSLEDTENKQLNSLTDSLKIENPVNKSNKKTVRKKRYTIVFANDGKTINTYRDP